MGIISKLKAVIGVADGERSPGGGTHVAVEREPSAPGERAVKDVDVDPDSGPSSGDVEPSTDEGASIASTDEEGPSSTEDEPVDSIKGIGTAYADRLAAAGVHSVSDLADADAEEIASETGLGSGRVGNWIERAKARTR